MAYCGLTIIFASFLIFLGQFGLGYSSGQCTTGQCLATNLGTYLTRTPDEACYNDGTSVTLTCEKTWPLQGPSENTCNDGTWATGPTTCDVSCSPLAVENLILFPDKTRYEVGDEVSFSCNKGYKLTPDSPSAQCNDMGNLIDPSQELECIAFTCSAPTSTNENLKWTDKGEKETYGGDETITYSCTEGFKLEGSDTGTCINQDEWESEEDPTCSAFNCSAPTSTDENLKWTGKGEKETYNGDETITYSCSEGFKLEGSDTGTCIDQNEWESEENQTCSAFTCSAPTSTDENLSWTGKGEKDTYNGDETITYSCTEGFKLEGSDNGTCIDQNKWEIEENQTCSAFNCSAPTSTDENLKWTGKGENDTYNGAEPITYSCSDGLKLVGSKTNTCIDKDKWKNEDPKCSGNVVQVFSYLLLMTTVYSVFSFNM